MENRRHKTAGTKAEGGAKWSSRSAQNSSRGPVVASVQSSQGGCGEWLSLGKQLQRMVSARLQDAEARTREDSQRYSPPRLPADQMDTFGREPLRDGVELVICRHCSKSVRLSKFCTHLGRCPRTLDMNFPPPGPDLCRAHNKRKSAAQSNKSTKRLRDQDENNVRPADSTPAAAGRPAKPSKAKAGADTSKRPAKPRAVAKAEGTKGGEQEKLKIRISLPKKSKTAPGADANTPENGEQQPKESVKGRDAERSKKERRIERQPIPLATRIYVRRNKLRCLALTFFSPPAPQVENHLVARSLGATTHAQQHQHHHQRVMMTTRHYPSSPAASPSTNAMGGGVYAYHHHMPPSPSPSFVMSPALPPSPSAGPAPTPGTPNLVLVATAKKKL